MGNAIKFTSDGEVTLIAENEPEVAGALRFRISDTGIGIPIGKQAAIFESFTQADSSTTREYGGTGLGLSISQHLVQMMGGAIGVKSQVGHGSTFTFTVQLQSQDRHINGSTEPLSETSLGLKVLVLDDNDTNRMILKEILSFWGATVTDVADGHQALQEIHRAKRAQEPYQLILLDASMPKMDGFAVAERIKESIENPEPAVLMLTTDKRSDDVDRASESDIGSLLIKPIRRAELYRAITTVVNSVESDPSTSAPEDPVRPEDIPPLSILLVEDHKVNRRMFQFYLKDTSCKVDIVENGQEAVDQFRIGSYDLVLMDMQMPVLDGYEATERIRSWEKETGAERTCVIALTANAMKEDVERTLAAGCDAHLTKPIRKGSLLGAIKLHSMDFVKCMARL